MMKDEIVLQKKRLNRAASILDEREDIIGVLNAMKSTCPDCRVAIEIQSSGERCFIPLGDVRDLLTDRLADYDRRLAEKLEAL